MPWWSTPGAGTNDAAPGQKTSPVVAATSPLIKSSFSARFKLSFDMSALSATRFLRDTSHSARGSIRIEPASADDWRELCELEEASFPGDRISARSWRALLISTSATVTLAREASGSTGRGTLVGATVVLQRARTSVARLYSIAIAAHMRGRGVSAALLEDATQRMRDAGAAVLRLETRLDNIAAQHLFARSGFVQAGRKSGYYEDGADGLLYEKSLWNLGASERGAALRALLRPDT